MSRILKNYNNKITQVYKGNNIHGGMDIVGTTGTNGLTDTIIAHSAGTIVTVCNTCNQTNSTGSSYGNYVKIKHRNGMYTLYAHMKYGTVNLKVGNTVNKGDILGYMGNTGHSFGAHLHFEVRDSNDVRINPQPYLDVDLPTISTSGNNNNTVASPSIVPKNVIQNAKAIQIWLNSYYKSGLIVDGSLGSLSKKAICKALQIELNRLGANLAVDGSFGPASQGAYTKFVGSLQKNSNSIIVTLWQCIIVAKGLNPKGVDGNMGNGCVAATNLLFKKKGLPQNGIVSSTAIATCIR